MFFVITRIFPYLYEYNLVPRRCHSS